MQAHILIDQMYMIDPTVFAQGIFSFLSNSSSIIGDSSEHNLKLFAKGNVIDFASSIEKFSST